MLPKKTKHQPNRLTTQTTLQATPRGLEGGEWGCTDLPAHPHFHAVPHR